MRKIEQQMTTAINSRKGWSGGNTTVIAGDGYSSITLHGNHIATVYHNGAGTVVREDTLAKWPTRTTISRLRALGVSAGTRKGVVVLNGKEI